MAGDDRGAGRADRAVRPIFRQLWHGDVQRLGDQHEPRHHHLLCHQDDGLRSGGIINGTYSNVYAHNADQYGGSTWEGSGAPTDYVVAGLNNAQKTYSLTLNDTQSDNGNVNYFGFWLSALDANNSLTFLDNDTVVGTFTTADVLALVGGLPAYFGNPLTGENALEPYVFINFLDLAGPGFDEIRFSEANGSTAGYESDNHTVGWFNTDSFPDGLLDPELCNSGDSACTVVNPASAVPEPASWAMMIAGFGLVGATMRRRRPSLRLA